MPNHVQQCKPTRWAFLLLELSQAVCHALGRSSARSLHGFRVTQGIHFLPAWRVLRTKKWWPTGRSPHVTAREAGNGERRG